jgi:hypothetical protein
MITDRARGLVRTIALALPLVAAGWLGTLAAVMVATDYAPGALVVLPGADLPADATVLSRGRFYLVLESATPGLARQLYAGGALLVLPSGLAGCLPQRG